MSSLAHMYGDFTALQGALDPKGAPPDPDDLREDARLEAYEDGYKSGWEDAVTATRNERTELNAAFVQQVEDLSFTYHEAHATLSATITPLLLAMISRLLPEILQPALAAQLADQLTSLAEAQTDKAVELAVHPDTRRVIDSLLADHAPIPFAIAEDPSLSNAQACLRIGSEEREINLDRVATSITTAVHAFIHATETERRHG